MTNSICISPYHFDQLFRSTQTCKIRQFSIFWPYAAAPTHDSFKHFINAETAPPLRALHFDYYIHWIFVSVLSWETRENCAFSMIFCEKFEFSGCGRSFAWFGKLGHALSLVLDILDVKFIENTEKKPILHWKSENLKFSIRWPNLSDSRPRLIFNEPWPNFRDFSDSRPSFIKVNREDYLKIAIFRIMA